MYKSIVIIMVYSYYFSPFLLGMGLLLQRASLWELFSIPDLFSPKVHEAHGYLSQVVKSIEFAQLMWRRHTLNNNSAVLWQKEATPEN